MKNWLTSFCARQLAKQRQPRPTQRDIMKAKTRAMRAAFGLPEVDVLR